MTAAPATVIAACTFVRSSPSSAYDCSADASSIATTQNVCPLVYGTTRIGPTPALVTANASATCIAYIAATMATQSAPGSAGVGMRRVDSKPRTSATTSTSAAT